ncbi:MAG: rhomboid family intramembrane serine protease, partial [Candidatus Marinimicrobia bacterium]|nr:rhomboid family intramembrane serine protease [Candidatus Neomarinimicrobiota bacterium]
NFLIPMKVKYFVMLFAAIELFASMGGGSLRDGVAHITHLSGMIFGYLFLLWTQHRNGSKRKRKKIRFAPGPKTSDLNSKPPKSAKGEDEKELDALMDRIALKGYDSLTEEEKMRLLELSSRFRKNGPEA